MKTCHVALISFYTEGHHAPYLLDLAVGLRELNVQVTVIGSHVLQELVDMSHVISLEGCERLANRKGMERQWFALHLCREAIAKATAWQATHIHFLYADWHASAIAAAWRLSHPVAMPVLTVHWSTAMGKGGSVKDRLRRYPHRAALRWLAGQAGARILVHHETVARELATIIDPKRIGIVPYPTKPLPTVTMESRLYFRKTLGVESQDRLVLCYGNTRFDKGADLAVRALARLPEQFHLLIAGQAQHFQPDELRRQAKALGVKGRIHVIPRYLSDEESGVAFHTCDIVLLPYRRIFSGQSGPMTQAAAIGKPVVAANLPVLAATIERFHLGMIFPSEDVGAMAKTVQAVEKWSPSPQDTAAFLAHHSSTVFSHAVYENYLSICDQGWKA